VLWAGGLGFDLRVLSLQTRRSPTSATPFFALVILEMGSHELLS
jgi:hypothetical protein